MFLARPLLKTRLNRAETLYYQLIIIYNIVLEHCTVKISNRPNIFLKVLNKTVSIHILFIYFILCFILSTTINLQILISYINLQILITTNLHMPCIILYTLYINFTLRHIIGYANELEQK